MALQERDEAIEAEVLAALDCVRPGRACVAFGEFVTPELVRNLLKNDSIEGVYRAQFEAADPWNNAVYVDRAKGHDVIPYGLPKTLIVALKNRVGYFFGLRMVRSGVRQFIVASPRRQVHEAEWFVPRLLSDLITAVLHRIILSNKFRLRTTIRGVAESVAGRHFRKLNPEKIAVHDVSNDPGPIVFASGSLGAGGSERQLTLTALGVKRKTKRDVFVICQSNMDGPNSFFSERVMAHGISVSGNLRNDIHKRAILDRKIQDQINQIYPVGHELGDLVWRYALEFSRIRPTVVHSWLDEPNVLAGTAAVLCGVPRVVLGCRSLPPYNFLFYQTYMRSAYRALLRFPNVTIANNSHAGARAYAAWLGIAPDRIRVAHNGVDLSAAREIIPEGEIKRLREALKIGHGPIVTMIGRISEEKRPLFWLDIAKSVFERRPDTNFLWIGDGPLKNEMRQRADQGEFGRRFHLPGIMNDVSAALAATSVFLLTSRVEGLPNVILEAQYYGAAVVTADVGGASEAINQPDTGIAISGDKPSAFADAVLHYLNVTSALNVAKKEGRKFIEKEFSADAMIDHMLSLYDIKNSINPFDDSRLCDKA